MKLIQRLRRSTGAARAVRSSPQSRAGADPEQAPADYVALLDGADLSQVAILGAASQKTVDLGSALATRHPQANVLVLLGATRKVPARLTPPSSDRVTVVACRHLQAVRAALLASPAPDVLIDDGGTPASLRHGVFSHLLPALTDGGRYLLLDHGVPETSALDDRTEESLSALLDRLLGQVGAEPFKDLSHDDAERVRMIGGSAVHGRVTVVTKTGRHVAKVHDEDADDALPGRIGPGWGESLSSRPRSVFRSRAQLISNRAELDGPLKSKFEVPARHLRMFRDVVCMPRQLALSGDALIPASFHHPGKVRLRNRGSIDAARWYGRLREEPADLPSLPNLSGTYYHLASEFPGHFGHVMTEELGRLWGWDEARQKYPDLKILTGAGDPQPPSFLLELLAAYGISSADVHSASTPVRVEQLVTASPQFHNNAYIDPEIATTWRRIADELVDPDADYPGRIFISRSADGERRCLNGPAVEKLFADAGFAIVRPETMTLSEQFTMFAGAGVIAGYAGSGLFTALASRPGSTAIVFASETYRATNEWLISSVQGFRHHQFWCPSTQEWTSTGFDRKAFHADFEFDFDRDGPTLRKLLDGLTG